jgi:hypothetical protein
MLVISRGVGLIIRELIIACRYLFASCAFAVCARTVDTVSVSWL